jgi:hypothetical protein
MKQPHAPFLIIIALIAGATAASALPTPNRGTQLFFLFEGYATVVAMDTPSRPVIETWHRDYPTYDFIFATQRRTASGSIVSFTRYVMKDDYDPREEHVELTFPYTEQPRYQFFDSGYVVGFYRHSVDDINPREFWPAQTSNQTLQPTAGRSDK